MFMGTGMDMGMDRLERGLRDLDRVDADVKATVDQYYNSTGVQQRTPNIVTHPVQGGAACPGAARCSGSNMPPADTPS